MRYILIFCLGIFFVTSMNSQSRKERYKAKILASSEFTDMKYAQKAHYLFKSDTIFRQAFFKVKNKEAYYLVLNELNDNRKEKIIAFRQRFKKMGRYYSMEEIHRYFLKPTLNFTLNKEINKIGISK